MSLIAWCTAIEDKKALDCNSIELFKIIWVVFAFMHRIGEGESHIVQLCSVYGVTEGIGGMN